MATIPLAERLDIILNVIAIIAATFGSIWATAKYIVARGFFPAAQLEIECGIIGQKDDCRIIEVVVHIINKGTATLIARNISLSIKIIGKDDSLSLYTDPKKFGRLKFKYPSETKTEEKKCFHNIEDVSVVPWDTFIQPGIDQKYPFTTILPKEAEFIFVESKFNYVRSRNIIFLTLLGISWLFGLIQFSMKNITKPHTAQAVFSISDLRSKS